MTFLISTKGISLINLLLVFYSMFPVQCVSLFHVAVSFIFIKSLASERIVSIFLEVCFICLLEGIWISHERDGSISLSFGHADKGIVFWNYCWPR